MFRMIHAIKDGENIICSSLAEFSDYRAQGWSATEDINKSADDFLYRKIKNAIKLTEKGGKK